MKKYTKGFTLIELLVVIAIIGILASVVLVSLNTARKKGNDTRVIADVQQMRTFLEANYNGAGYPDLVNAQNTTCNANNFQTATYASCMANSVNSNLLASDAVAQGGNLFITPIGTTNTYGTAYALRGQLVSNASLFFCIDSTGRTNPTEAYNASQSPNTCY